MNQINFKITNNQKINLEELAGQIFKLSKTDSDVVMTLPEGLLFSDIQKEKIQGIVDAYVPTSPNTCTLTLVEYIETFSNTLLIKVARSQEAITALNFIFPFGKGTFTSQRALKLVSVLTDLLEATPDEIVQLKQIFVDKEIL